MTSTPPAPPSISALPEAGVPACRCVVARGRSPRVEMRFEGDAPLTCRVGASRDSDWWVTGGGVPDQALELHWDGDLLWVADRAGHGLARVDGEALGQNWRGLGGACRLEFPGGALVVECSRPGVVVEVAPRDAASVPPVRSDVRELMRPPPMQDAPTKVAPLKAMLMDEPTRTWRAETRTMTGLPSDRPDRPRTIVPPPSPAAMVPPPSPAAVDELQEPTREILKSGSAPRAGQGAAANQQAPRTRRASTGG